MSAFVCILDRSGAPLDRGALLRLAEPLESYGTEVSSLARGPVGIAVRHRADARAAASHGPREDPATGLMVAAAGHFAAVDPSEPPVPAAEVCSQRDLALLERVAGSFVLISGDPRSGRVSLARDHLGASKLYYYLDPRWLIAASEPAAVLRHEAVSDELDQRAAARFLGFRFAHDETSFFRRIRELPPGHRLEVSATENRQERYWGFRNQPRPRAGSEPAVHAELRRQLRRSMSLQMDGLEPQQVALSLSGGLDSTALAALAPPGVRAFSWFFEDFSECDERRNVDAVSEHLGLPVHWVDGDGLYPLSRDFAERFVHPNSPHLNAFAALKARLYQAARAEGCTQVMVGDGGDALYGAQDYWLRDCLMGGCPGALRSLAGTLRDAGRGDVPARRALRRLLPVGSVRHALRIRPAWLTREAWALLPRPSHSPILPAAGRRSRWEPSVGVKNTELESEERRLFAQCGVERSNPFWHWPLLEMVNNLPAYWLRRDGQSKLLSRAAFQGLLPERVLTSARGGLMGAFFLRGLEGHRQELRESVFRRPRSDWQRWVDREWLEPYLDSTRAIQFGHTILWRVISYELWQRRLIRPATEDE